MVKPYLNQVGGKVENDVNLFDGGLNTYVDKAFLESNQMPYVMNMTMRQPPAIQTRKQRGSIANLMRDWQLPWSNCEITNMWAYNQDLIYFIRKVDELTYDLCLLRKNGSTYSYSVIHTDTSGNYANAYFCYGRTDVEEFLYLGNENFKAKMVLGAENPLAQYYDGYTNHFGIPCWHKSRLWLLKPSSGKIEWSNALMPDNFDIGFDDPPTFYGDSGELPITSQNGRGALTGLVSFDDKLVVFCEHSTHAIYGSSGVQRWSDTNEQDPNYFQVVDLVGTIGCLSQDHIALSGGSLFWLGDDKQVYEYTGGSIHIISRPNQTRYSTISIGGIDNVLNYKTVRKLAATSSTLYVDTEDGYMFVFDCYNKTWWCENGGFACLANYSQSYDNLLMATTEGDILSQEENLNARGGFDSVYDFEANSLKDVPIEFEFHTRLYGAEGVDQRKTLSDVWFQMHNPLTIDCDVYINDVWCAADKWNNNQYVEDRYVKIGSVVGSSGAQTSNVGRYDDYLYEQRHFPVEKMFGERLNTFQIIVKGEGWAKFFLMKREWRSR